MLTVFLAGNGGRVLIPEAVEAVAAPEKELVWFVDGQGRRLAIFRRRDVVMYLEDGDRYPLEQAAGVAGATPRSGGSRR